MNYIAEVMQENRERIAQLQAKLNASTIKSGKLKEQIEKLEAQYEEKVKEIAELKQKLAEKDIEIKALSDTIVSLATENTSVKADLDAASRSLAVRTLSLIPLIMFTAQRRNLRHMVSLMAAM